MIDSKKASSVCRSCILPTRSLTDLPSSLAPFASEFFRSFLRARGATQVVLTGIATSVGVESTARNAYDLGYNVTLVVDTMAEVVGKWVWVRFRVKEQAHAWSIR